MASRRIDPNLTADSANVMLDAYNAGLELAAEMLKMIGCDDPKKATPEQLEAVVRVLLAPAAASGMKLTSKQIMADHRKLTSLKRRQAV